MILKKIFRLFLILLISVVILGIGSRFHFLVQNSSADVFDVFKFASKSIPDFREGGNYSQTGKTIVNGIPFTYSVEVVNADIDEIIDYYKKLYTPPYQRIFSDEQLEKAGVEEGSLAFRIIRGFEIIYGKIAPPVLEYKTPSAGFLGVLDMGDNTKFYLNRKKNNKIVPKVVMAFKENPDAAKTTIIKYCGDRLFDASQIFPSGNEDLPGFDLEGIDRHPYSQRILSIIQKDDFASSKMVVYRVDDNIDSTIIYYAADLRSNGWSVPESVVKAIEDTNEKRFIYAKKGDEAVYITFSVDNENYTQVVMVERNE